MEGPVKRKEDLDSLADRFDKYVTYTVSPRKAETKIAPLAGADINTLDVKTTQTHDVLGERPEDFGTTTVFATLARMKSDFSRRRPPHRDGDKSHDHGRGDRGHGTHGGTEGSERPTFECIG
jgi:hypothetical protein